MQLSTPSQTATPYSDNLTREDSLANLMTRARVAYNTWRSEEHLVGSGEHLVGSGST